MCVPKLWSETSIINCTCETKKENAIKICSKVRIVFPPCVLNGYTEDISLLSI